MRNTISLFLLLLLHRPKVPTSSLSHMSGLLDTYIYMHTHTHLYSLKLAREQFFKNLNILNICLCIVIQEGGGHELVWDGAWALSVGQVIICTTSYRRATFPLLLCLGCSGGTTQTSKQLIDQLLPLDLLGCRGQYGGLHHVDLTRHTCEGYMSTHNIT